MPTEKPTVKKSLLINFIGSKCSNLISKILVVFTSIFSYSLFSQIYVESNSVLTVTEDAFISSEQSYKAKLYITNDVLVYNLESFSGAEKIQIKPEISEGVSKNLAIASTVKKDTLSKHKRKTTKHIDVKKETLIICSNTDSHEAFNPLNNSSFAASYLSGNLFLAVFQKKADFIPFIKDCENLMINYKKFSISIFLKTKSIRPPPIA